MAELARFDGIIIRMYAERGGRHHAPHFHAYYADHDAVYGIKPVLLIAGALPNDQHRKVVDWAKAYQKELLAAWNSLLAGRTVGKIS